MTPLFKSADRERTPARRLVCGALLVGLVSWGPIATTTAIAGSASAPEADHGEWRRIAVASDRQFQIYQRERVDGLGEFKGVMRVRSSLSAFVAALRDTDRMSEWLYRSRLVRRVAQISPTESLTYSVTRMDWPMKDRDVVLRSVLSQDPVTLAVTVESRAEEGLMPPANGLVRMPRADSVWRFAPVGDGIVEVEFTGHGDPGGSLGGAAGQWLVDLALWEAPLETLKGLRRIIVEPRYQQARFDFIREPADMPEPERTIR